MTAAERAKELMEMDIDKIPSEVKIFFIELLKERKEERLYRTVAYDVFKDYAKQIEGLK